MVTTQQHRPGELPGWAKASIFGASLIAVSWLVMWLAAAAR